MWLNCKYICIRNVTNPKHHTEKKNEIQVHHCKILKMSDKKEVLKETTEKALCRRHTNIMYNYTNDI